ncbi:GNAT family N-acetyltransferase [Pseudalkalibacillus berkeleyi]|uniref:GNAT family N-acetyltransferase n=1 Tax=Pseudalkalibacillus berkeleyi TaxID=1069813 RepID=A0ABS9GYB2_9BACL|nr:GNAT family N-acetyltransferase [Pseudalkalibacillus berkeleyi]MCF6137719.1 GNAT family N-acetyltransferase [Pseudalkalibacillus berkeleyi]
MTDTDIKSVKNIAANTWKDTYSSFIPIEIQEKTLSEAYSNETMDKRFKTSMMLVAEEDEQIKGYAFFSSGSESKEIFLESLYVHPSHQGKGIGKKLYVSGIERYHNPTSISLTVYKGNLNISFYEKEGFKIVKETEGDFCGHPVVFIKMTKNLI